MTTTKPKPKKIPLAFRFIRWFFPKYESLFPGPARRWAIKLFITPMRFPYPEREQKLLNSAQKSFFEAQGQKLAKYEWGDGQRVVVLLHGWSGRATQFSALIEELLNKGFRVIAFDAPAHGKSTGKTTNLVEFSTALKKVIAELPEPPLLVGHSLGSSASFFTVSTGIEVKGLAAISTPAQADEIITTFEGRIKASPKVGQSLANYVEQRFGQPFTDFSAEHTSTKIEKLPVLLIHDRHDREASVENLQVLKDNLPGAETLITEGLGHSRILKDKMVAEKVADFFSAN